TGFQEQLAVFDGTSWKVNEVVRYFNGADYWEQSAIYSTTLTNNSIGNIFSVTATGSENMVVDYSIIRGSNTETGRILMTSDGSTVRIAPTAAFIGDVGTTFDADIDSGNIRLRYSTDNSGSDATMKFSVKRWSNAPGGPAG